MPRAPRKKSHTKRKASTCTPASERALAEIRARIDEIDERLQSLLNERARLAQQVGESKKAGGKAVEYYRPEREAEVLRKVIARNTGPLKNEEMIRLFREIMSACLSLQEPLKVAYLGPEGTFSQQAVLKHFGHSVRALPVPTINEVFEEVQAGHADFGVVPIENSTEGTVNNTLDMFLNSPLKICGEVELRIHQHLMGRMRGLEGVLRVCSHQQSLAQCRHWLQAHLPNVERIPVNSNAEAARRARDEVGTAAIAGETAAHVYELNILAQEIEDRPDNTTRFFVIGRKLFGPSGGKDRTTLMLSAGDTKTPGALYRLLEPLAKHQISMTRIESRPSHRGKWDYLFFIDVEGHAETEPLKTALEELRKRTSFVRVLGSYPVAIS
jgi:chorismate mutase/prephenate dehydratase